MNFIESSGFKLPIFTSTDKFEISTELLDHILKLEKNQQMSGGNNSTTESYVLDLPIFKDLKKFIQKHLDEYFHDILNVNSHTEIYITQSWFNYNGFMSYHHKHYHQNSLVSGSFYIQGPNVPIAFERDSPLGPAFELHYNEPNEYNSNRFFVNNEIGKLVLFPSNMQHDVVTNNSPIVRISLAFNTFVRGTLGNNGAKTELKLPRESSIVK